ncbi:unnamed protein product, partial [Cyprideis torosa]
MLEGSAANEMDRKQVERGNVVVKHQATSDSPKAKDVSNSRNGRPVGKRREFQGATGGANVPFKERKPGAGSKSFQKGYTSGCDRRPVQRQQEKFRVSLKTSVTEEDDLEEAVLKSASGKKKTNLTHLLNFNFGTRGEGGRNNYQGGHQGFIRRGIPHSYSAQSFYHCGTSHGKTYNKEHFLQAICQFVVRSGEDYSVHMADPDLLVDWTRIEEVRLGALEPPRCPICLSTPLVAPKMTRCGHVFCWPCMLHYLALSDKTYRKCPICYEAVHRPDMKSVLFHPISSFDVGETIEFTLMKRVRNSNLVSPVLDEATNTKARKLSDPVNLPSLDENVVFAKLIQASIDEVIASTVTREKGQLDALLVEDEGSPEVCFVEEALKLLDERKDLLLQQADKNSMVEPGTTPDSPESPTEEPAVFGMVRSASSVPLKNWWSLSSLDGAPPSGGEDQLQGAVGGQADLADADDNLLLHSAEDLDISEMQPSNETAGDSKEEGDTVNAKENAKGTNKPREGKRKDVFYFYQASDGQQIFLHAVNVQMLVAEFGSLEACPRRVQGKVLEKESSTMSSDLRYRLRYLGHLPLSCPFEVAEIALDETVSAKVLSEFSGTLEARRKRREKKERDERRRSNKIQIEETRKLLGTGRHRSPHLRVGSLAHFPQMTPASVASGGQEDRPTTPPAQAPQEESAASPVSVATSDDSFSSAADSSGAHTGPSFAQMLLKAASPSRPRLSSPPSLVANRGPSSLGGLESENEEDGISAPDFAASFGDAIAQALQKGEQ